MNIRIRLGIFLNANSTEYIKYPSLVIFQTIIDKVWMG